MRSEEIKRAAGARALHTLAAIAPGLREGTLSTTVRLPSRAALSRAVARLFQSDVAFGVLMALCYVYFLIPAGTNTLSRYDMVYALSHGTAIIDYHAGNTIDVSYYQGHWYSPRSLGLSIAGMPVLWLFGQFADLNNHSAYSLTTQIAILNAFTVVPAAIAGGIAVRRFAARIRPDLAATPLPMVVAGAFAFATLAFPFSTTFFSHAFGGALAFIGFYLLYRSRASERPELRVALAGLLVGFAAISEYPVGLIALLLALYLWMVFPVQRVRMLAVFALGILPNVLLLGWYNWFAFGSPFHLSYAYVADEAFAGQHEGFFGITVPHLDSLLTTLTFPRGLLMESPFLMLVPLGLLRWLRARRTPALVADRRRHGAPRWMLAMRQRRSPEGLICLAVTVLYPIAISAYFLPMAGENLPGPRLLVPLLPFACLALIWVVDDPRRWVRYLFAGLLAYGVLMSFIFVALGVRVFHTYGPFPLFDLYLPVLTSGIVPRVNGETPDTLATMWFGVPRLVSLWLLPPVLAVWTALAARALAAGRPTRPAARASTVPPRTDGSPDDSGTFSNRELTPAGR